MQKHCFLYLEYYLENGWSPPPPSKWKINNLDYYFPLLQTESAESRNSVCHQLHHYFLFCRKKKNK